jgi:hypothetical protein
MSRPLLRTGQYLLIVALFGSCGGHWLVLQSVAWGAMLMNYSERASFSVAVEKTFDGQHPCGLCQQIEKGKKSEQKQDVKVEIAKLTLFHQRAPSTVFNHRDFTSQQLIDSHSESRPQVPPVPPPRGLVS